MSEIKLTKEDVESLELKTDLAYKLLNFAVGTKNAALLSSARVLYEEDIGRFIREKIKPISEPVNLCKRGKRGAQLERYILQYVLMSNSYPIGDINKLPKIEVCENPGDGMGGLKAWIDAEDKKCSSIGVVYRSIQEKARKLRNEGRYDLILNALSYARGKYPSPAESCQLNITISKHQ